MDFKYMDISPYAKNKVFFCSHLFYARLREVSQLPANANVTMRMQEGTTMAFMENPMFPITLPSGETIHGMTMAFALGDIPPASFVPAIDTPKEDREIWTFKL